MLSVSYLFILNQCIAMVVFALSTCEPLSLSFLLGKRQSVTVFVSFLQKAIYAKKITCTDFKPMDVFALVEPPCQVRGDQTSFFSAI